MTLKKILILAAFISCTLPVHAQSKFGLMVSSNSFSNALPIKELVEDEWKSRPEKEADLAYTTNLAGFEYQYHNWYFSATKRLDLIADTNPDTVLALYQDKMDLDFSANKTYQLNIHLKHIEASQLSAGYQYQMDNLILLTIVSYIQFETMRESQLAGEVSINDEQAFSGQVSFTEYYTDKNLLKRPYKGWNRQGEGASLSFKLNYQIEQFNFQLNVWDLFSHLKINETGYSGGTFDTQSSYRPELGLNSIGPLFKGWESEQDAKLKLNRRLEAGLDYQTDYFNNVELNADFEHFANHNRIWFGASKPVNTVKYQLMFDPINLTPQLGLKSKYVDFNLAMDSANINKAKQIKLNLNLFYTW
ncbi:hypothetical protein N7931_02580 [Catenovulum sp. 2E275]|uniref:hypothetical protein n=1 Tax=Catenovulum sp. 2E275 TaxID=2980497 RepID=UPI0021CEB3CA|nr:hypothetical protein [Catenovulum sp. 2E275]MCU4674507.1 hypothetical protein [Catenovulum sp. 2E275]